MLFAVAMLLAASDVPAADAPAACAPAAVEAALRSVGAAMERKDEAAARAAIAPAAACPVTNGQTYAAHIFAADLAARRDDWGAVRALLTDTGVHAETLLGIRAQFLKMRADQGLGDAAGFLGDRGLTVAANDARLTAAGEKVETFRAGTASVTAYRTPLDQGSFHRVLEFIAVPDDQAAYPVSVMLTDDRSAAIMMAQMKGGAAGGAAKGADAHAWFVDLYTCTRHSALAPVGAPNGAEPGYAAVKARVVEALGAPGALAAPPPEHGACSGASWLMPGFGLRR